MRVLIACECSGAVRRAFWNCWIDRHVEAYTRNTCWSVDLKEAEDRASNHYRMDALYAIRNCGPWDLMIAHPECRYMCNSGVLRLYVGGKKANGKDLERWAKMEAAARFYSDLATAPVDKICLENSVMHGYAKEIIAPHVEGWATQIIQPYQFGEDASKATRLQLKNLGSVLIWFLAAVAAFLCVVVVPLQAEHRERVFSFPINSAHEIVSAPPSLMEGRIFRTEKVAVKDFPVDVKVYAARHNQIVLFLGLTFISQHSIRDLKNKRGLIGKQDDGVSGGIKFLICGSRSDLVSALIISFGDAVKLPLRASPADYFGWSSPLIFGKNDRTTSSFKVFTGSQNPRPFRINKGLGVHKSSLCCSSTSMSRFCRDSILSFEFPKSANTNAYTADAYKYEKETCCPRNLVMPSPRFRHGSRIEDVYGGLILIGGVFIGGISELIAVMLLWHNLRSRIGWIIASIGALAWFITVGSGLIGCLPGNWHRCLCDGEDHSDNRQQFQHNSEIVPHKRLDTLQLLGYIKYRGKDMANVLNMDKQIMVIGALAEGSSIRSIERMTGVHRDTVMRLGVKVGQGCTKMMDASMRNLPCTRLELDEIWGFVGKKEKHVRMEDGDGVGSVWTFCAIDADTKLVPAFKCGDRSKATANAFMQDVASRLAYRVQISTDGLNAYVGAIENAFGGDVDYAQIIKVYGTGDHSDNRRYSAPDMIGTEKTVIVGNPDQRLISTSYVERLNATTRLHMRRLTRLTLAFSKKRENFEAAVGLHFAYYNFVKRHNTLRCTPAMAAGVAPSFWSVGDLLEAAA